MDRLQNRNRHRHEDLTGGRAGVRVRRGGGGGNGDGSAMEGSSRRGRFSHHDGPGSGAAAVPVVDQAECTAQTCRSCVAVTLADAIALGCCPCAVVSLLGLAFVKAPLALARRCLRRLRRRRGELRHQKRVRDMDVRDKAKCRRSSDTAAGGRGCHGAIEALDDAAASKGAWWGGLEACGRGEADTAMRARASNSSSSATASGRLDAEKVWMEMYRVGHWGFGRLSISVSPPPPVPVKPGRSPDGDVYGDGGRKDANLRCES